MNRNQRPTHQSTGIFRIHGKEYNLDTFSPLGLARPEYKIFSVWTQEGESLAFASEEGFECWLEKMVLEPVQRELW